MLAAIVITSLIGQPAVVLADVYSGQTFEVAFAPVGEPVTDYCSKAGVVDTARNYGASFAYRNEGAHDCGGTTNPLPAGWIGVRVDGLRDGASCGTSSWYHSSQSAWGWQVWIAMCANPSGSQEFRTRSWLRYYDGSEFYFQSQGPLSPIASY
jgi:hypothetical protein